VKWRILALTALSSAVLIGSVVVAESGGASSGMGPDRRGPTGPHVAMPRAGATRCRVIPDTSSATPPPLLAVIGASFTAGTGAPRLADSWAVRLAELIRWRAVTLGVPGAGYTEPGFGDLGPVSSEVDRVRLARLHPSVVVIQAGHDDWRVPRAAEANRVAALVRRLRADVPAARLAFLTVFSRPGESTTVTRGELRTDSAIVSAVRKVDPQAIVIDPLRHHWRFPRARGGLHPTARGHLVIAERVARALVKAGVVAAAANRPSPAGVTCVRLGAATGSLPSLKKPQKFIH
jgi:lysophospholipase L1-like esterase